MTLQRKPEHSFQKHAYGFLKAVVLEPREIRSIDKAGAARSVQAWAAARARGVLDGTGDILCVQGYPLRAVWFECKRPDGKGIEQPAQLSAADAYAACGVQTFFVHTIQQILDGLRSAAVRLSANADVVARVYQEHVNASERTREAAVLIKRSAPSAPKSRFTKRHRKAAAIYAGALPRG